MLEARCIFCDKPVTFDETQRTIICPSCHASYPVERQPGYQDWLEQEESDEEEPDISEAINKPR